MLGGARMHCTPKLFQAFPELAFFHGQFVRGKWVHVENPPIAPYSTDVAICMWCFYCTWLAGYEIAAIESERLGDTGGGQTCTIECTVS